MANRILPENKPSYYFNVCVLICAFYAFLEHRKDNDISKIKGFYHSFLAFFKKLIEEVYHADYVDLLIDNIILFLIVSIVPFILSKVPHSLFVMRFVSAIATLGISLLMEIACLIFFKLISFFSEYFDQLKRDFKRDLESRRYAKSQENLEKTRFNLELEELERERLRLKEKEEQLIYIEDQLRKKTKYLNNQQRKIESDFKEKANTLLIENKVLQKKHEENQSNLSQDLDELLQEKI